MRVVRVQEQKPQRVRQDEPRPQRVARLSSYVHQQQRCQCREVQEAHGVFSEKEHSLPAVVSLHYSSGLLADAATRFV